MRVIPVVTFINYALLIVLMYCYVQANLHVGMFRWLQV